MSEKTKPKQYGLFVFVIFLGVLKVWEVFSIGPALITAFACAILFLVFLLGVRINQNLDKKIEEIDKLNSERAEAAENITKLQTKIDEFEANIKAIEERERKVEKVEWDACFQKQRADEIKQIFEFTLRSPMIRRSISESAQVPVSTRDGYASTVSTNRTVTETVEEPRY